MRSALVPFADARHSGVHSLRSGDGEEINWIKRQIYALGAVCDLNAAEPEEGDLFNHSDTID